MQNEIILILIGVVVGFIGVAVTRMSRSILESRFSTRKQYKEEIPSTGNKNEAGYWPAWLKLVETPKASIFETILERTWAGEDITFTSLENMDLSSQALQKTIRLKESFPQTIYENRTKFSKTIRIFNLARTQILGRDEECQIVLSEINVSRRHALINFENENYVLYDISSSSGVYVNGSRVASQGVVLKPDDLIIIGLTVLIFEGDPQISE